MNNFPVEVLVNIFQHLPQNDLTRVSEVCEKFNQVITDFKLIRHLILSSKTNDESVTLTRKYTEVTMKDRELFMKGIPQHFLQVFTNHITKLTLSQCTVKLSHLQEILNFLTKVKFIHLDYVQLSDETIDPSTDLPQLKNVDLVFAESNPTIFKILGNVSARSVDLRFYGDVPYSNFNDFCVFLKLQTQLSTIKISGIYESNLFMIPMGKSNFQLKEFKVQNCDFEEYENFEAFLLEHEKTIEKFTVSEISNWDSSRILNQFKNLKRFEAKRIPLQFLEDIPSVEELVWESTSQFNAIQHFPNVRKLELRQCQQEINQFVNTLTKLRELKIFLGNIDGLNVPNIRKLELQNCEGLSSHFFEVHTQIEDLILYVFNLDDTILMSIATNLRNLKSLRIFGNNQLTSEAFNIIGENCKSLKVIEITHWVQKFKNDEWKSLTKINGLQIFMRDL